MKSRVAGIAALLSLISAVSTVHAKGAGTSGGLTLLESPTARSASLAEAFTAANDDVAAFAYNPSTLRTLRTGQASFLYQKGLLDDAYSQLMVGGPWRSNTGVGLSVGYYNGGNFDLSDGVSQRSVTAQKDLMIALGAARAYGPLSIGLTGKYLNSTLVESQSATAYAVDLGMTYAYSSRLTLGGALQNFGTEMKYQSEGDKLPRIFRLGASYAVLPQYGTVVMFDVQRMMNEGETRPALGVETRVGPMALRAGYRHGSKESEFTVGTGFAWGRNSLDYSFGLINSQDLNSNQRISYSFRFGGGNASPMFTRKGSAIETASAKTPNKGDAAMATAGDKGRKVTETNFRPYAASNQPIVKSAKTTAPKVAAAKRMYTIKSGDSLASIARDQYGDPRMWRTIYMANKHLISSPTDIEAGQKIALP